jgi:hypothetical protein
VNALVGLGKLERPGGVAQRRGSEGVLGKCLEGRLDGFGSLGGGWSEKKRHRK